MDNPIANSYWITNGRLLAGGYPGAISQEETSKEVRSILEAGVTAFVDLTEEDENPPYTTALSEISNQLGTSSKHIRMSIGDMGVPTKLGMSRILSVIDEFLENDRGVYVHCWGGIGRTGTVIGCYMVEQGMTGAEAIQRIEDLRKPTPYSRVRSPDNEVQRKMVLGWGDTVLQ